MSKEVVDKMTFVDVITSLSLSLSVTHTHTHTHTHTQVFSSWLVLVEVLREEGAKTQ